MKKLSLLLGIALIMLTGCKKTPVNPSTPSEESTPISESTPESIDPTVTITVKFYLDYNQVEAKNVYTTQEVKNGEKLTKPADPTTPLFTEFPVFKGWSKKEIVDDDKDLWNFSTDVVRVSGGNILELYGIWVAEGE